MSRPAPDLGLPAAGRRPLAALLTVALLTAPLPLHAGSTRSSTSSFEHFMPQGSDAGTANGDYVSSTGALGIYRYFIEVPSGLTRLVVDIFDADIGDGDPEADVGRDRARANDGDDWNTSVTYSLVNPAGSTRNTQFTTGNSTTPTGADAAWLSLFDSTGDNVRDNFGTAAYNNNDGTVNWAANWDETNDDDDPAAGLILITGGELRIRDDGGGASTIHREANLSGAGFTTATLSFTRRTTGVEGTDEMLVQVSGNGGGAWTTLETFTGAQASATETYDITAFIATNTRVRFIENNGYTGTDSFFVDNLQIQETNIDAGHWELRVDMGGGNDINALGIRAHDGTSGSGGTELNAYYDSHSQFGVNPDPGSNTRSYTVYPYITSGCLAYANTFDYDTDSGDVGSLEFDSRTGTFSQDFGEATLSIDDDWDRDSFTGWTSDTDATENGIWSLELNINTYGSTSGNYTNLWMSNFNAASDTPTANPTTNAFRVYLPTDGGAAPLEPYLEQMVRFTGCGLSGPNPPAVGQTSCYTVTVRMVNPAAQAITFSASNLVTANIPGSGAVYAGGAQVSQGTIVSQPSVGGTGNITWNPGTIAAGDTEILSYRVNVTPTSSGQRIPVTATPASGNGTRAQYVDTTGNTTQTRATYLFGPLCELAVTQGLLTQAVVSSFRASPAAGGGVLVEWQTASETGTVGFNLYRRDPAARKWVRVNRKLLAGLLHAEQGGTYRFVDEGASPGEPQVYKIEEIEASGGRRLYGPYTAAVDWNRADPRRAELLYERDAHPAQRRAAESNTSEAKALSPSVAAAGIASAGGVHLSVQESGLYQLPVAHVAAWFGVSSEAAAKMIAEGQFVLSRDGESVAYYPDFAAGGRVKANERVQGLLFYGEASGGLYGDASVYRLQRDGKGMLMQTVMAGKAPVVTSSFQETLHAEQDALPATVLSPDPESDYWFWEYLQGDDPTFGHRTFNLDAPGLAGGSGGSLAVTLHGATATGVTDEHQATVSLNGVEIGEVHWTGIAEAQASFPVAATALRESGNQVEIAARTGDGAPYSVFYVDSFDLSYQRSFHAVDNALAFTPGSDPQVTLRGFTSSGIRLLDIGDPLHPRWIMGALVDQEPRTGYRLTFVPWAPSTYLAAAAFKLPSAVRAWSESDLRSAGNRADYVVIAPAALRASAERLANLRRSQGLEATVVDLDEIMDEFNFGASSPHAIRGFLTYAYTNWSKPPRYVALAGEGTLDYRNLLGYGDNLLPPLMIQSQGGLFPSDNRLGDVNGDGLPEMAVGRIPVLSAAELDAYTDKIAAYEAASTQAWTANTLLLADTTDQSADFTDDSERIAAQINAPYTVDRIYLSSTSLAGARAQLLAAIDSGASFINYVGHGGLDRLSSSGLLTNGDVAGLANGERLPVFTAMTCTVNRFAVPGVPALGELLVKNPSGGAAAVWGPSGLSTNGNARLLAELFYHAGDEARLGDRVLRAVAEFLTQGGDPSLPPLYDVMGDPALRLSIPPVPPVSGGATGE